MNQCLYLDGRARPLRVALYGAALEVVREGEVLALAPLGRLRRISCLGRVDWAGDALMACAAGAVAVSFLRAGRAAAHFLPARPPARSFGALIEDAGLHPAWNERLEDWTDSELRRSLMLALRETGQGSDSVARLVAAGDSRQALRAGLRILGSRGPDRRILRHLLENLHAWAVERLLGKSLFLGHFGFSSDKPNLPERLAHVVSPLLLGESLEQARREAHRRRPSGPVDGAGAGGLAHRCALAFEHAEPALARRFDGALRRFERLVRDCAEEVEP